MIVRSLLLQGSVYILTVCAGNLGTSTLAGVYVRVDRGYRAMSARTRISCIVQVRLRCQALHERNFPRTAINRLNYILGILDFNGRKILGILY
jgi:hypothetical protein